MNKNSFDSQFTSNPYISLIISLFIFLFHPFYSSAQIRTLDWPIAIVSDGHGFTEGPAIDTFGMVYFSDMDASHILRFDPETGNTEVWHENSNCANGLYVAGDHLFACEAVGRVVVRYDLLKGPGSRKVLMSSYNGKRLGSPNDLTVIDQKVYFSEFYLRNRLQHEPDNEREIFLNRVYILSLESNEVDTLKYNFRMPNGVAVSPCEKHLYVADIQGNMLLRFSIDHGAPGDYEIIADLSSHFERAAPDGMAISEDGRIFLALFGAGLLLVLDQDGQIIGTLPTGPRTTNCVFAADSKTLYITADGKLLRLVVPDN